MYYRRFHIKKKTLLILEKHKLFVLLVLDSQHHISGEEFNDSIPTAHRHVDLLHEGKGGGDFIKEFNDLQLNKKPQVLFSSSH